ERLPWDSLGVDLGPSAADGIVAPGSEVPVSITYNILWPDTDKVVVRATAVLRPMQGGDPVKPYEFTEVMPPNRRQPPVVIWSLRAPEGGGTYVLETHATWEPEGRDGSRLGRLIRRRKPAAATSSAVRRIVFTVLDPLAHRAAPEASRSGRDASTRETEV